MNTRTVTIYGASDDLIEIEGDINEEFTLEDEDEGDLLAVSDGTILRINYMNDGVWRIALVQRGTSEVAVEQAPEGDEDNYSDRATITGEIAWVVQGIALATTGKARS